MLTASQYTAMETSSNNTQQIGYRMACRKRNNNGAIVSSGIHVALSKSIWTNNATINLQPVRAGSFSEARSSVLESRCVMVVANAENDDSCKI